MLFAKTKLFLRKIKNDEKSKREYDQELQQMLTKINYMEMSHEQRMDMQIEK